MTILDDTAANSDEDQTQQDTNNTDNVVKKGDAVADDKKSSEPEKVDNAQDKKDDKPVDDWRVRLAGGDEKELKRLSRFASEADVYKAYRELEKKKSSGELKNSLAKDATPEELAQWRKENGIPETPDKYDLNFENGLVIGEEDKPLIDEFINNMHGKNATPEQVKTAIATYYDILAKQQEATAEADTNYKDESISALKEEWGGDYKKNITAVNNLLENAPEGIRDLVATARTADGKILGNSPEVIKWLAAISYEINPVASVMPSSMSNPGAGLEEEIASIEKMIGDRNSDYWKGARAEKLQSRYGELLSAREKMNNR